MKVHQIRSPSPRVGHWRGEGIALVEAVEVMEG